MSTKYQFLIEAVIRERRSPAVVARENGVSPSWLYKLLARYRVEGEMAYLPRSRQPHQFATQIPFEVEEKIVMLRKQLSEEGFDAGAATLHWHLAKDLESVPSITTIWRTLKRRGFITPQPKKRPRSSFISFCADLPNECWQSDFTHWALSDGTDVEILNFIDDHSRLCVASVALAVTKTTDVVATFHSAADKYGLPATILTDNGRVYTARNVNGQVAFELELKALGIDVRHGKPYHPTTQGKVERFQQTLKQYLRQQPPATSIKELQRQVDAFVEYYNSRRPHRSLERRTPQEVYDARIKARPDGIDAGVHYRIRVDRVDKRGAVTLRYNSKIHHIGIGAAHKQQRVVMLIADRKIRVLNLVTGELLRSFELDPTRDYQPRRSG